MEVKFKFPGGYLEIKREPWDWDRFLAVCVLIGVYLVGSGFIKLFMG